VPAYNYHLYGDDEHEGLIPQLSKRIGVLKKLSTRMSKERLKLFAAGIYYSKLSYCLPVFGNVFGLDKYKEVNSRYSSFTISDNQRLQVLQNNLNRLLTGSHYTTTTSELLEKTSSLSIQQMIAYQTIMMMHKIMRSGKPTDLANKIQVKNGADNLRGRSGSVSLSNHKLSIVREGFVSRGSTLMNILDTNLRRELTLVKFKAGLREWVKRNISIKPVAKFPTFSRGRRPAAPAAPAAPPAPRFRASQNPITMYFQPQRFDDNLN
jgi:hypothetical protein